MIDTKRVPMLGVAPTFTRPGKRADITGRRAHRLIGLQAMARDLLTHHHHTSAMIAKHADVTPAFMERCIEGEAVLAGEPYQRIWHLWHVLESERSASES